jgi:hypothetical protein
MPTLIEDLEEAANLVEAYAHDEHIEAQEWADANDRSESFREVATRLRGHSERMRVAAAHEAENAGVNEYHAGAADMLASINGGGIPLRGDT